MPKYWAKKFKNIILTGLPGVGKTSFGKIYAHHSERHFLDFYQFMEAYTKKPLSRLLEKENEEKLAILQEKLLFKLERRHSYVIAMGSHTLLKPEHLAFAKKLGLVVLLKENTEDIAERVTSQENTHAQFSHLQNKTDILSELKNMWEKNRAQFEDVDVILTSSYGTYDTLKLQLAYIEQRAGQQDYMHDVENVMRSAKNVLRHSPKMS